MHTLHEFKKHGAVNLVTNPKPAKYLAYGLISAIVLLIVLLFLPWTQNVRSSGKLTTLTPYDRPQDLHSVIDGRVEQWYVQEGDSVKTGDTIVFISETKDTYWDPQLLNRTQEQIVAKTSTTKAYADKVDALNNLKGAEKGTVDFKLSQARNKVKIATQKISIDSAEFEAAKIADMVAREQMQRAEKMYEVDGLLSLKDLEDRRVKFAEAHNKLISAQNKLSNSRQELVNATIELSSIQTEFYSKIYKIDSDIQSANSDKYKAEEDLAKLKNMYSNYQIRQSKYYVIAPRDGQIVKIFKQGLGENVKQGEPIASIASLHPNYAVELYIQPIDVPLMRINKKVRVMFDGWPTIVFSGWPGASYGTFGGRVAAIDNNISPNGKYRILVAPDPNEDPWPEQLKVGTGARGIALLNTVPIWYELWRRISGFPPDFYQPETPLPKEKK